MRREPIKAPNPIPYALMSGLLLNGPDFFLNTDANGNWSMNTPQRINYIFASQFGYETSDRHYPIPLIGSTIQLSPGEPAGLQSVVEQ